MRQIRFHISNGGEAYLEEVTALDQRCGDFLFGDDVAVVILSHKGRCRRSQFKQLCHSLRSRASHE